MMVKKKWEVRGTINSGSTPVIENHEGRINGLVLRDWVPEIWVAVRIEKKKTIR
jgi:hypothetical protein